MTSRVDFPEDDGRVIADMSDVSRTPVLIPDISAVRKSKEEKEIPVKAGGCDAARGPEQLDKEGRRAMVGGALSAMLLVGGIIFAAFAAVILIIGHLL